MLIPSATCTDSALAAGKNMADTKLGRDLVSAAGSADLDKIRQLLADGADPNFENMQGHTALIKVVWACDLSAIALQLRDMFICGDARRC